MLNKNVVNYMGCDCGYEEADLVLFGAPFDSTTSFRPGTRFAGGAIRSDSYGLELYSPYQDRTLEACRIFDMGDLELSIGSSEKVLGQIEETAGEIFRAGKRALPRRRGASGDAGERPGGRLEVPGSAHHTF